ncbi:MAG: hypothetical protein P8127_10290, partial [Acidobacteriota bacterium]
MRKPILVLIWLLVFSGPIQALAEVTQIGPADSLQAAVNALAPGDILLLQSGTYVLSSRFSIQNIGTASAPITIRAAPDA